MWLVVSVALVLATVLAWICGVYVAQIMYKVDLAGPRPVPILGNLTLVKGGKPLFQVFAELQKKYGNMFLFYFGINPIVVITDHQAAREVLTKKFRAFHDRPLLAPVMKPKRAVTVAYGILFAKGSLWTSLRAAAQPIFHADSLSQYAKIMNDASTAQVAGVAKLAESGAVFNFADLAGSMTMRVIMQCAFGVDLDTQGEGPTHPAITAANQFFNRSALRSTWFLFIQSLPLVLRPLARSLIFYIGDFKVMEAARDTLFSMSNLLSCNYSKAENLPPFVVDREVLGKGEKCDVLPADAVPSRNSVIAAMMHAKDKDTGAPLNSTQLLAQANTFILAGYETTAGAVTFAVYMLANNPEAESKLLKEIDAVGRDTCPTYETLDEWPYAKACIRETMRKQPIAPMLLRTCVEATTVAGVHIPKGVDMYIPLPHLHNNPEHFPEPEKFRPERFLEAEAQGNPDLHPAYMPFGAGPHNCIGWRFAMEEAVIMLVRLYQKFIFRLSEAHHPPGVELPIRVSITIAPRDGLWVKAIPR